MSLFWLLSLLFLAFGFGVLVWTFVWVSRLLARRAEASRRTAVDGKPDEASRDGGEAEQASPGEGPDPEGEAEQKKGLGVNATLGLILGAIACLAFALSPLTLAVSAGGIYFSLQALWTGIRVLRTVIGLAVLGLALSLVSVGLHYLRFTGGLPF